MKILLAPAQFKESMAAAEVARVMSEVWQSRGHQAICEPVSDGGEGFLEAFTSRGGQYHSAHVLDPLGREISSGYVILNQTAIVEMARASGIELVKPEERDVFHSSTYGTGQLIHAALGHDVHTIIVSMGGSATNDVGIGMLQALGVEFKTTENQMINGISEACHISSIDSSSLIQLINNKQFIGASDVRNPLLGKDGATHVFGPQKGLAKERVDEMEELVTCFSKQVIGQIGADFTAVPGSGAAGGLGFALRSFLNAELTSGFEILADIIDLEERIQWADLVITGEGKLDHQTSFGKAPARVRELARRFGKKVIAVTGTFEPDSENYGFDELYSLTMLAGSSKKAMEDPEYWIRLASEKIADSIGGS